MTAPDLLAAAKRWIDGDPEPHRRAELSAVIERGDEAELSRRMASITFGTAGLRGPVGAGSGYMNRAVVLRTAFGIARFLAEAGTPSARPVVLGFDARPDSRELAEATAGVLLAAGVTVLAFAEAVATPLVAFVARESQARLAVVVTASHNPRGDAGFKVYGGDGVQISTPVDREIAGHIAAAPAARDVPCARVVLAPSAAAGKRPSGLDFVSASLHERYFEGILADIPQTTPKRDLVIAYSPLHGVGWKPLKHVLSLRDFRELHAVPEQVEPDGAFPTTPFPNPEEPGTVDLALALGKSRDAALVLLNDPDADRLAAGARLDGELTMFDGNQLGALLASFALDHAARSSTPLVLSSVVSSPVVEALAVARGAHHERTLTGFKWLWSAALALEGQGQGRFAFAFEEALGYSLSPRVRDKDGISAALALCELAVWEQARARTLYDRLFDLYAAHGFWTSGARNVALEGADAARELQVALGRLASAPPALLGLECSAVEDYRSDASSRPPWRGQAELLELRFGGEARVLIRPSGTEPKIKIYAHARQELGSRSEFAGSLATARARAIGLADELARRLRPS